MGKQIVHRVLLLFPFIIVLYLSNAEHLQSSQVQVLLKIKSLLNSPPYLETWNQNTDFCNAEPSENLTVVCYEESITQLHLVGNLDTPRLPNNFSTDSFFTTLAELPSLKVLTLVSLGLWGPLPTEFAHLSSLEIVNLTSNFLQGQIPHSISSLQHLQTLILERNNFTGVLPEGLGSLSAIAVLNVKGNSLYGNLPKSLEDLENLRVLVLSSNNFSGEVPDFSGLTNLQMLDLANNSLGPRFPSVGDKIETIVLKNNKFTFGIPEKVQWLYQLKTLDISSNRFVGPFPVPILSLPSIAYLDISGNKLTGMLFENLACNDGLYFVNLTDNLLTGKLPTCLVSGSEKRIVTYGENCLQNGNVNQQPVSFCKNAALAVGILPHLRRQKRAKKVILALSICGGAIAGAVLVCASFLVVKKFLAKRESRKKGMTRSTAENAATSYTSKILKDARYITRAMKLGALGLPAYRTFSVEELKEATNNFNTSASIGDGSNRQMYKGRLRDGSHVAIRCINLKRNQNTQYFMPHVEMISKLRHHHLVSALGHCFEYYLDDSSVSRVFLVFEYVPNGTLRSWISEWRVRRKLTWAQRIAAATGIAKGIQFLHTGIVPGLFANNIQITDVLLDQNLVSKITSYNLPLLTDNMGKVRKISVVSRSYIVFLDRAKYQDKLDIHDFGAILLEIISGRPITSRNELEAIKFQFEASTIVDDVSRKSLVDSAVKNTCSAESVKTMMEMCCRCLHENPAERPSIEDVLWNLQFAAQVQEASQSSEGSPISPLQSSSLKLTLK
ncbi:Probable inactive leucine-rich repeat receptor-like protein kinase [Striga hermonthica]|uniref:Probable inactive leucine-rich repeat receptor-like protein kinase n=1 Tax=Striga hermonthica TaxID=68872 RepID=A0A9N7RCK3_STRHE|nr:Probable inactive leucine-rich repeat receptor-like protein kinase [Striga hermonthica]